MSNVTNSSSQEKISSALSAALGTAGTVLVLEFFRIPNSYMSLSLASILSLLPRPSLGYLLTRIGALTLGIIIAMMLLTAFPQAPWFSLPLAGLIPALGYSFFFKHSGPGSAYSFGAYFLAFYIIVGSSLEQRDFFIQGIKLWSQTIVPICVTYLVALLIKDKIATPRYAKIDLASMVSIGVTVSIAIMLQVAIKTDQGARLVMASISTISALEIEQSVDFYLQRMLGFFLGALVATAFLVYILALGNDISVYLLGIGTLFGILEWLACSFPSQTTLLRGITAMVSFSILMIPAPDITFHVAYERITTSLLGFFTAIVVYLAIREFKKMTERLMTPPFLVDET
jgi:uncharacterized membrane protein YccC